MAWVNEFVMAVLNSKLEKASQLREGLKKYENMRYVIYGRPQSHHKLVIPPLTTFLTNFVAIYFSFCYPFFIHYRKIFINLKSIRNVRKLETQSKVIKVAQKS